MSVNVKIEACESVPEMPEKSPGELKAHGIDVAEAAREHGLVRAAYSGVFHSGTARRWIYHGAELLGGKVSVKDGERTGVFYVEWKGAERGSAEH